MYQKNLIKNPFIVLVVRLLFFGSDPPEESQEGWVEITQYLTDSL